MDGWQGVFRTLVIGRKDGIRAAIRRELNVATWLDDDPDVAPTKTEAPAPEPGWEFVTHAADLPVEGEIVEVFAGDQAIVLVRVDGEVYAVDSVCPHAGGPLGEGELDGTRITCPWHGWSYDVTTGKCGVDPSTRVETFAVRIDGEDVFVSATPIAN